MYFTAIRLVLSDQVTFDVTINIFNTNFNHLNKSSVLKYHVESCGTLVRSILNFQNCTVEHNQGDKHFKIIPNDF